MTDSVVEEKRGRWVEIQTGGWEGCMHDCLHDKTCWNQFQIEEMIWGCWAGWGGMMGGYKCKVGLIPQSMEWYKKNVELSTNIQLLCDSFLTMWNCFNEKAHSWACAVKGEQSVVWDKMLEVHFCLLVLFIHLQLYLIYNCLVALQPKPIPGTLTVISWSCVSVYSGRPGIMGGL